MFNAACYFIACVFVVLHLCTKVSHVKWVHCHNGMARPRVADRGDGLQIWRAVVNIVTYSGSIHDGTLLHSKKSIHYS
jgi:hypothetical protein